MIEAFLLSGRTLRAVGLDEIARASLGVQRALWSTHSFTYRADVFYSLESLGALLAAADVKPAARRADRLERLASALLAFGFCLGVLAALHAAAFLIIIPTWVLTGDNLWPAGRAVLLSLSVVAGLLLVWLISSVSFEEVLARAEVRVARLSRPERLRALAWTRVELEAVPVSVLVDPGFQSECVFYARALGPDVPCLLVETLWSRLDGLDRQTVEMLAQESGLSLELARRAALALG